MISFKEFFLLEKPERLAIKRVDGSDDFIKIIINPKEVELKAMLKRSRYKELRGLINSKIFIIWDSNTAIHDHVLFSLEVELRIKGHFANIYITKDLVNVGIDYLPFEGPQSLRSIISKKYKYLTMEVE